MKKIEKIFQFIKSQGITNTAFEQKAGLSNGYLRNIAKTGSEISGKMLSKMFAAFPELENYLENSPNKETGKDLALKKAVGERENKRVPMIGEALAGTNEEMNMIPQIHYDYVDVGDLLSEDAEAAFTVYGNSMTPGYPSGTVLGLKRNYDNFIQPGELYVLETRSNRVFKRLYYNEDKTAFVCYSDNTMIHETGPRKGKFYYEPFEIKINDAIRVYDVVGMIKRTRNSGIITRIS